MIWFAAWPSSTAILWPSSRQPCGVFEATVWTWERSKRAWRSECANAWFCGDPLRQRDHKRRQLGLRHDLIDHAEPVRFLRAPDVGGEQQFLGFAWPQFPGMNEPFDATNAHRDHRITKFRVTAGDDKVTG